MFVLGSRIAPDQMMHIRAARLQLGFESPPNEARRSREHDSFGHASSLPSFAREREPYARGKPRICS